MYRESFVSNPDGQRRFVADVRFYTSIPSRDRYADSLWDSNTKAIGHFRVDALDKSTDRSGTRRQMGFEQKLNPPFVKMIEDRTDDSDREPIDAKSHPIPLIPYL